MHVGDNSTVAALFFSDSSYYFGYRALGLRIRRFNCPNNFQTGMRKHDLGPRIF